ncbi:cell division cycle protein 20 homolog [Uranotaenia lowii]|uniref:cell division cycle protein 20 homolog n=1 Tax=Uranotaenia lowii TaxID=190385 RepID=UPI0024794273|nr:cell division cycle protein 20 homolog [Uranotaenia lowii]XP_055599475.1 cell division cycle protein 20 homolog [Uranotaenia lowii]XP_055599476.1 cell division cycle protein 20 homolog [Uranotaenia lowii]
MAQFNYINELNNILTMDGELTKGPAPRWQKKLDMSAASTSFNATGSMNTSRHKLSMSFSNSQQQIPAGTLSGKTPKKHSGSGSKTSPGKTTKGQTPSQKLPSGGDRFIPNRATTDFDLGHFIVKQSEAKKETQEQEGGSGGEEAQGSGSPRNSERIKILSEAMKGCDISRKRVLSYQVKAPAAPDGHMNPLKVVYSVKTPMSTKSGSRFIPNAPERILDAPDIINDYYLNLMDWSGDNVVAVALGSSVYLWNAATGNIEILYENEGSDHACALGWIQEGHILAVGTSTGTVELWDCEHMKRLRVMDGHVGRVGVLAWNSYIVCSGSRDASIINHDVRSRDHSVAVLRSHTQEVCGLKWSTDGKYLASGGNDNMVHVWSAANGATHTNADPIFAFNQHQAAVRALAWCPWQPHVLASGGGTADRCIKFWNVNNGQIINSVDTKSQVCGLLFSKNYKELISAHGYVNNQLTVWKYPSMTKQIDLLGHTGRVLQIAMSPDGSTVMSAGADETLRLWNCFQPDPLLTKKEKSATREKPSLLKQSIR